MPKTAPVLYGTQYVARQLKVPGRTVRRWCQRQGIGQMVLGRRVLTAADIERLRELQQASMVLN